jgi:hypothetical protein
MIDEDISALIASVYEAILDDRGWERLTGTLSSAFGSQSCLLQTVDLGTRTTFLLGATPNWDEKAREDYKSYYFAKDPWVASAPAAGASKALVGHELIQSDELLRSEFYNDFCKRIGTFHLLGALLPLDETIVATVGIQRPRRAAKFVWKDKQRLEILLPHLTRAAAAPPCGHSERKRNRVGGIRRITRWSDAGRCRFKIALRKCRRPPTSQLRW